MTKDEIKNRISLALKEAEQFLNSNIYIYRGNI